MCVTENRDFDWIISSGRVRPGEPLLQLEFFQSLALEKNVSECSIEDFFVKMAYEACNAPEIVPFFKAFAAAEIHSRPSYFFTVMRKISEQIQEIIHGRTVG